MILVVQEYNEKKYRHLLDEMFRLRARVFSERLKWDVRVTQGLERDKFDDLRPVYLIYTDGNCRKVKGSLRLLPTTGPTVLSEFFFDTLPSGAQISAPTTWECTRLCLDEGEIGQDRRDLMYASLVLLIGVGELGMKAGIQSIIGNLDSSILRLYRQIGCDVEILGSTLRFARPVYLASHEVSLRAVEKLKKRLGELGCAASPDTFRLVA
jgi:acyl homoserine lactone synthase